MVSNYKNYKISVHIPLYVDPRKKMQLKNFKRVCKSFFKISNKTKIFVHTMADDDFTKPK